MYHGLWIEGKLINRPIGIMGRSLFEKSAATDHPIDEYIIPLCKMGPSRISRNKNGLYDFKDQ